MNVIFLTLGRLTSLKEKSIYHDLMKEFVKNNDNLYIVTPAERRSKGKTELYDSDGAHFLKVRTLNVQKTSMIEKGLGIVMLEWQYNRAIKRYLGDIKFDLVLYTTPPITLANVVKALKRRNPETFTYLLLKDIFPQNAALSKPWALICMCVCMYALVILNFPFFFPGLSWQSIVKYPVG